LLSSLDLIKEENKLGFMGPGPVPIPVYSRSELLKISGKDAEIEAFSQDRDWMPRLVLIAKNTYVWLDQLSKEYKQEIHRLDQIPDAEIQTLARRGITGLWLIGLWERSSASAKIKQLCGNPEAISSAYSLHSYDVASDLGGYSAYEKLRDQAKRFGIRLASDMVPNHMGIDSDWVIHPTSSMGKTFPLIQMWSSKSRTIILTGLMQLLYFGVSTRNQENINTFTTATTALRCPGTIPRSSIILIRLSARRLFKRLFRLPVCSLSSGLMQP
jgi:hypothetical protein